MDLAKSSQKPWVDLVKGRQHVLELLALTVNMRIDGSLHPGTVLGSNANRSLHPAIGLSRQLQNGLSGINSLSSHQQIQVSRDFTQQMPPARALSSKGQLNQQFHVAQSGGDSKVRDFVPSKAFGRMLPAYRETQQTEVCLSAQTLRMQVGISTIGDTAETFAVPSKLIESTTPGPLDGIFESQKLKELDRPIISWLNKPKENRVRVLRKITANVIIPRQFKHDGNSSREFSSSLKNGDKVVVSYQARIPESDRKKFQEKGDPDLTRRDSQRIRKREKTRSGLSCFILGETSETERCEELRRHRRNKYNMYAMDVRPSTRRDVERKERSRKTQMSNTFRREKKDHMEIEQTSKPFVISFGQLLQELLSNEEEVKPFTGSLKEVSDSEFPQPSAQLHEDGLPKDSHWSEGQNDLFPPDPLSESCMVEVGNSTRLSRDNTKVVNDYLKFPDLPSECGPVDVGNITGTSEYNGELVHGEPGKLNRRLDVCLLEPDKLKENVDECLFQRSDRVEEDTKMIPKLVEMERLADKMLDSLVVDVAAEVAGICSLVVDNLIIAEFGHAAVTG